ncbi:MFS transporter [Pseudolysinimonas kribbensis]|uniref:MFS transporter n=1 Tax=Pseudolysinimonas kribbensis TaxID=433641 RepID=A0ABQ6K9D9_9MICO|nr:MFS transporter [Pseudolysinimonas kribbensis]GMA96215.1 MFS transporter [Pseudolysinimonas kribbensis]
MTETASAAGTPAALAEPRRRVGGRWIAAFAAAWLGVWMAQLAPFQQLLPLQVERQVGDTPWQDSVLAFGVISGIAGVCAIVAYPLTGALSDRTTSRFGRRRPWIAGGALLFALAVFVLGFQNELVGLGICWALAIVGFCVLTAALTATISDQVPVGQRGVVAAFISAPQAVGIILGIVLVTFVFVGDVAGYTALAVLLVLLVIPFLVLAPDARLARADRPPFTLAALIEGMWVSPRAHPDFGWTLLGRILVNIGNALGTGLLLYFLEFGLHLKAADANDALLELVLVYMVFIVIASLVGGRLSDRIGRRKPFVIVAAILQAVAALLLGLVPVFGVAMVGGALLGLGYGSFLAVDQALATQVLPDPADRGKDLGIMNIALAVPQALAPCSAPSWS